MGDPKYARKLGEERVGNTVLTKISFESSEFENKKNEKSVNLY